MTDNKSIRQLQESIKKKDISAEELIVDTISRIKKLDEKIRAFITVCEEQALDRAKRIDSRIAHGEKVGILAGLPYSAKDVFSTKDIPTTASSKILEHYIPPYSATSIEKLDNQDAILIGKTNNDAFGFGSSTENSDFQITHNPWDLEKVPGGSSGGSAAAVAARMGIFSMAEDTGGSIRQPASFCGVTGIKVTYGRVSRYGVLAYGSSLDTIGIIAQSVADTALLLKLIAGTDSLDATTLQADVPDYEKTLTHGVKGVKIGIPKEYFGEGLDDEVGSAIDEAIKVYEALGAKIMPVSLPYTKYAIPAYYLSGISEVSANLARYDGIRFGYSEKSAQSIDDMYFQSREKGFGDEVKRRIMLGTYALSSGYYDAYYKKAQQVRTLIKQDFDRALSQVDILIAPVSPTPPFRIGENTDDPLKMWLADAYTVTVNPAGVPSLALPCGFTKDNLPIGMQLIGGQLSEPLLFQAGYAYQQETDWHTKEPKLEKNG